MPSNFRIRALCLAILAGVFLAAPAARAYVTSATLELMADDKAGVYLNGKMLLNDLHCEMLYNWFMCLSTSDNTLPLELFRNNEDNLLGIINYDIYGGEAEICYRLTVNQSNGDPIVLWGEPGKTKFINRLPVDPDPPGWYLPDFDDSKWLTPNEVVGLGGNFIRLADNHLKTFLGAQGYLPLVAPTSSGSTIPHARNLYRNHFMFPNAIAKADLRMNPQTASHGQQVAIRVIPGRDAADISNFSVFTDLPAGLEPVSILDQGAFNPATRQVKWQYHDIGKMAQYISICAEAVLDGGGWKYPERALGCFKPELMAWQDGGHTPIEMKNLGAAFWPQMAAWFKTSRASYTDGPESPLVLGVIFRAQCMAGGNDTPYMKGVNDICLNYSVDGTNRDLLKEDKALTHCANSGFWQTGYYDASEDRKWTWADINNLRVKLRAHQAGNRQLGRVVSVFAVIRCLTLQKCAPSLLARVTSTKCEKLRVNAGLAQTDGKASASDSFILPVNQQACIPPTRTPTPLPGITPLPTPVPGPKSVPPETIGLSCLQTSPEPFRRGGVFIYFCLKMDADIVVEVSKLNGEVARTLPSVTCRSGNSQMFFNAVDSADRPLAPGGYIYTIKAITTDGKYVTSHHASFTRGQDLSAGR